MKKKFKFNFKSKKFIFAIIVLIVIAFFVFGNKKENVEEGKIEYEEIEKRNIVTSIGATGKITTTDSKTINSMLTGSKIATVNVKKGDEVKVGDIICTFDTSSIADNLKIAEESSSITQAQTSIGVDAARKSLTDAINNKNETLDGMKKQLDDLMNNINTLKSQVSTVENNSFVALTALNSYMPTYQAGKTSFEEKETAYKVYSEEVTNKQAEYDSALAKEAVEQNKTPENILLGGIFSETLQNAQTNLLRANANFANSQVEYNNAQATFAPIKAEYERLKEIADTEANRLAELNTQIANLEASYSSLAGAYNAQALSSDNAINSLRDNLKNSELSLKSASLASQAQINAYKEQLSNGIVKSTVNGTVTSVNVKKGDLYSGSAIAVVEGCNEFIIEAEIDEYDIPDVEVGMKVLIKTDATRDEELEGRISYVSKSSTNLEENMYSGASATGTKNATYKIEIELLSQNDRLRLGMNARLSIITDSKENVWSVPCDAIYERDDGTKYIEILKENSENEKEELDVKTGIEGIYYIEIISSKLKNGMKVVLPERNSGNSLETLIELMGSEAGM